MELFTLKALLEWVVVIDAHTVRTVLEWIIIIAAIIYGLWEAMLLTIYITDKVTFYKEKRKRMKYANVREAALAYLNNRIKAYVVMAQELGSKPSLYIVFNQYEGTYRFQEVMHQTDKMLQDTLVPTREDGWFLLIQGGPNEVGYRSRWENVSSQSELAYKYRTLDGYVDTCLRNDLSAFLNEYSRELKSNLSATKQHVKYT